MRGQGGEQCGQRAAGSNWVCLHCLPFRRAQYTMHWPAHAQTQPAQVQPSITQECTDCRAVAMAGRIMQRHLHKPGQQPE